MDIIENIRKHKYIVLGALLGILLLLMLVSVLLLVQGSRKTGADPDEVIISIDPAVFLLPDEPLELPPVQYSRKQKKIWTEADLEYWYTIPDADQMQKLHEVNEQQMKKLWESVP
ncbi:MAG: hypothetical protein P1P65_04720 [Treponema sp.]